MIKNNVRKNDNWEQLVRGEPVVSDYIKTKDGKFVVFLYFPLEHELDRTKCPLGGSLSSNLCWSYGSLDGNYP